MSKGANIDMSGLTTATGPLTVALSWIDPSGEGEADVSVLLANADGKVDSDEDFVFYNQPATVDESVRLPGKTPTATGSEDRILVDLTALRPEVQRLVIAASRHAGATFGALIEGFHNRTRRHSALGSNRPARRPGSGTLAGEVVARDTSFRS